MKNYYEILQVNENASKEIIEKAYKVLVKKYHPDLQKDINKKDISEKQMLDINEAYDVLSNPFLKEQYDLELRKKKEEEFKLKYGDKDYGTEKTRFYGTNGFQNTNSSYNTNNTNRTNSTHSSNNTYNTQNNRTSAQQTEERKRRNQNIGTINGVIDMIKMLYQDRPKRQEIKEMTKKDLFAVILTILIVIVIGLILWCIPFTNGWIREVLFDNPLFQLFGRLFGGD